MCVCIYAPLGWVYLSMFVQENTSTFCIAGLKCLIQGIRSLHSLKGLGEMDYHDVEFLWNDSQGPAQKVLQISEPLKQIRNKKILQRGITPCFSLYLPNLVWCLLMVDSNSELSIMRRIFPASSLFLVSSDLRETRILLSWWETSQFSEIGEIGVLL